MSIQWICFKDFRNEKPTELKITTSIIIFSVCKFPITNFNEITYFILIVFIISNFGKVGLIQYFEKYNNLKTIRQTYLETLFLPIRLIWIFRKSPKGNPVFPVLLNTSLSLSLSLSVFLPLWFYSYATCCFIELVFLHFIIKTSRKLFSRPKKTKYENFHFQTKTFKKDYV